VTKHRKDGASENSKSPRQRIRILFGRVGLPTK